MLTKLLRRATTNTAPTASNLTSVSDEQVHHEVYSASDILERESEAFIKECNEILSEDTAQELRSLWKLGFHQSKSVAPSMEKIRQKEDAQKVLNYISAYKQKYPLLKFITEEQAGKIAEKYDLYITEVENFTGHIPVKNQKEILLFRVFNGDLEEYNRYISWCYAQTPKIYAYEESKKRDGYWKRFQAEDALHVTEQQPGFKMKIIAPKEQIREPDRYSGTVLVFQGRNAIYRSTDPIVLQPVIGGYLIVTAWGKEANDVSVQNEALN